MERKIKIRGFFVLVIIITVFIKGYFVYNNKYRPNVNIPDGEKGISVYVGDEVTYDSLMSYFTLNKIIKHPYSFKQLAKKRKLDEKLKTGHYRLTGNMSNNVIINMFVGGLQTPVKVVFNNIRLKEDLAKRLSEQLVPDSSEFAEIFNSDSLLKPYSFTPQTIAAMFIPNTYELYWTTSASGVCDRMFKEYNRFWNKEREAKLEKTGLTKMEVSILASIIDEETRFNSEKPIIAGVYINRLKRRIRLQADPTVKFALHDFEIKRVLRKHLEYDSPYNTYRNYGLPPGPIRVPSISAIDAVLNYSQHKYLYFCAKSDFSGKHVFATTLSQHLSNARIYQRALNANRIWR